MILWRKINYLRATPVEGHRSMINRMVEPKFQKDVVVGQVLVLESID